jgi:translocation and assembly module TamB
MQTSNNTPSASPKRTAVRRLMAVWISAALTLGGLWWWSGTAGSLASTLRGIAWLLPSDQKLSTAQVQGSLRHGGQLAQLHWQQGGLQIQARNIVLPIDWSRFWHGTWPLASLSIDQLHLDDQRPTQTPQAMTSLQLPLRMDLPWRVDHFTMAGASGFEVSGLQGHYRYTGPEHTLEMQAFEVAQGRYTLQARLQAAAPMALQLQLQGRVHPPVMVNGTALDAKASVEGTLSGQSAALHVQAQLQPPASAPSAKSVRLQLQAQIHPWQKQTIVQAKADWQHLNLATLWPGAPHTSLTGEASVTPEGPAWRIQAQLNNQSPGPWDQRTLPLSQLNVTLQGHDAQWQVQQLHALIAGGSIHGQGQYTTAGWTGQVQITEVQTRQVHTALANARLQGHIQAHAISAQKVSFNADLRTSPVRGKNTTGLRLDKLLVQGQWQASKWDIQSLDLQAADAQVQGQFVFTPEEQAAQGNLQLSLPGLQAQMQGLLAPAQGHGNAQLDMRDAELSMAWLRRFPGGIQGLQSWLATGTGQLKAQWQGGYQQAQTTVQLNLSLPSLIYQAKANQTWQVPQADISVQGPLRDLQAKIDTRLQLGAQTMRLQSRMSAHSANPRAGPWQGQIDSALAWITSPGHHTPWKAQLQQAVPWQWTSSATGSTARWQAGHMLWQGPLPGTARLLWDAGQWQSPAATAARRTKARAGAANTEVSVRVEDLPLSWLPIGMAQEIQSDLLLKGHVKLTHSDSLQLQAVFERSQGDLRVQADNAPGQHLNAGLSEARVQLQVDGEAVQAQLRWQSEQMGQAQVQLQTRLSHDGDGWHWPEQAPISGRLSAQLPRVGAWSLLAPPGWRVQGTLDTQLELSGTRQQPHWQGGVQAANLAVRSAVQGIEFSQGQLRARVRGQQVDLEQLSLRGAGAQGGELQAQGQLTWLAPHAGTVNNSPWGQVHMLLQMQANALRVSNRADRRLAISGQVKAQMLQGQLQLRGQVQANQALFILPDDSTPTLGQDVVVLDKRPAQKPSTHTPPATTASWIGTPDVQVTLDLGPDFQIQGMGLTTRLAGQVNLLSHVGTQGVPRLNGEVRAEGGRYKAYGQQLNIATGVLRFNGPYDNPQLDILAIRPNLSQRVGVQISGTALNPKVRLYADPDMPDADKLAWLVLGRSAAGGGAESAVLQQAALALFSSNGKTLSSEMANALGLDEISLASGSRSDSNATGAAVTLGKRLSKDFYLVYETSLRGTFGSFYVFYDLSRRLTLRAQAGQDNALDLIYTVRKD